MRKVIEEHDLVDVHLKKGSIIGGSVLSMDNNGIVLKTGPADNKTRAFTYTDIDSIVVYEVELTSLGPGDFCYIGDNGNLYPPSPEPPIVHNVPPKWSSIFNLWNHNPACNCSPGCNGGWSKTEIGISK